MLLSLSLSVALAAEGAPAGGVALRDLMTGIPGCSARPTATPELDFQAACVGQVCVGMPLAEVEVLLGAKADCPHERSDDLLGTHCDLTEDLRAVVSKSGKVTTLFWMGPEDFRSSEGLGIGSSLACFVDRYADSAVSVDVRVEGGRLLWRSIHFREPALIVTVDPEGRARKLQLTVRGQGLRGI